MTPAQAVSALLAGSWALLSAVVAFGHAGHDHAAAPARPAFDYEAPQAGSYRLPVLKPAADGRVVDERGRGLDLASLLDGRVTVLSFVYTRCADVCPLATLTLAELHAAASAAGLDAQLVSLSFDPEHDTPEVMADQARMLHDGTGIPWRFLTTAGQAELRPILAAYDQPVARKADAGDVYGPIAHALRVYLIDRERRVRNIYSVDFLDPRLMLADLRTLLLERSLEAMR